MPSCVYGVDYRVIKGPEDKEPSIKPSDPIYAKELGDVVEEPDYQPIPKEEKKEDYLE